MPFVPAVPRTYSVSSVRMHAPEMSGVYGITNAGEWLYIGASDNIQASLLQHLDELNPAMQKREPTGFVFEICDRSRRPDRQTRLVSEYSPTFNRTGAAHQ